MTVAQLLDASRRAHRVYREHSPRMTPQGRSVGDPTQAGAALTDACRLRTEAHALDSEHTDPAWVKDGGTHPHDALLTFYADQLSR